MDPIKYDGNDTNLFRFVFNNPSNITDPTGQLPPFLVGCAIGGCAAGVGSLFVNFWESSWADLALHATCDAAGGCFQGAITATFPGIGAGCLGGAINSVASNLCKYLVGLQPNFDKCTAISTLVNTVLGCVGGAAAGAEDANINAILALLGFNEQAVSNLCPKLLLGKNSCHV
jgi:hypothetical protein